MQVTFQEYNSNIGRVQDYHFPLNGKTTACIETFPNSSEMVFFIDEVANQALNRLPTPSKTFGFYSDPSDFALANSKIINAVTPLRNWHCISGFKDGRQCFINLAAIVSSEPIQDLYFVTKSHDRSKPSTHTFDDWMLFDFRKEIKPELFQSESEKLAAAHARYLGK